MTGSRQTSAGSCVQVSGFGLVHLTATERGHQHTLKVVLGDLTLSFDLHSDSHPHVVGAAGRAPLRTDPECPAGRALRLLTCCQRGLAAAECDGERPASARRGECCWQMLNEPQPSPPPDSPHPPRDREAI